MTDAKTARGKSMRSLTVPLALLSVLLYAGFVEWFWGWRTIAAAWRDVGGPTAAFALVLLVSTYVLRAHRIGDYFSSETRGQFARLMRVTQVHNLLNIMLPFRAGETSFPLLMQAEFGVPLARGTAALLVLRLLDLHALLAAAGLGLVAQSGYSVAALATWAAFLASPLSLLPFRRAVFRFAHKRLPARLAALAGEVDAGIPGDLGKFVRAWALTALNWGIKVLVLAWLLGLMGVSPIAACFGGALGGELSSVLPLHAPGGVGTYPAGIAAGAAALGAPRDGLSLAVLGSAGINVHLMIVVSAIAGTLISLLVPTRRTADR
jgi:uncharacterized membrane protein YbhN (UPF0104 family)